MSFIKESYLAYKKVQEVLEKETSDHEIAMARSELEGIADKATATSSMLEGMTESGNPLPAWVQSKITNASDYITSVHDYLKYNPQINESVSLEETTFEKIYQMQQDGKSVEDIAKELNLKADLVKKVLGESKTISEGLSDAQIAQLKKEYEPLKGKTITTSQYQQLKNILFKLQDGDLEKLQKQNIPFASTGAGSILRVRKGFSHITTKVTVPGLEGMAEGVDMSKVTKYKMISIKGDQKIITIDRKDLEKYLKQGYVIHEPLTEEQNYVAVHVNKGKTNVSANSSYEAAKKAAEKFGLKNTSGITVMLAKKDGEDVIHKATEEVTEEIKVDKPAILKSLQDRLKKLESDPDHGGKQDMIAYVKSKIKMIQSMKEELEEGAKRYKEMSNVGTAKYVVSFHDGIKKHNDGSDFFDIQIFKNKEDKTKFITDLEKKGYRPIKYVDEETELKPVPSLEDSAKKHNVDIEVLKKQLEKGIQVEKEHTKDEKTAEKIALAHLDERPDYYDQLAKVEKKPVDEACWTGYKQVGLKKKGKRMVPNCVKEDKRLYIESIAAVKNKAEKTGMPYSILKQVYDRGMAAWKGGHRPGATQVQWALARVNSFVTKSSGTWGGADSDLAKKVKGD